MAHVRRKFEHARDNNPCMAEENLVMFQQLYAIERRARELSLDHEQIKDLRTPEIAIIAV
jgi:transposase